MYLDILPRDLILELSLYLNYRDSILAFQSLNKNYAQRPEFWLNKIHKELGYSQEFIKEYVYDNGIMKTLLPLNEKYLELKARHGVDFGTEQFNLIEILLNRAARLNDFALANELIDYLLYINKSTGVEAPGRILPDIIANAISVKNIDLTNKIIDQFTKWRVKTKGILERIRERIRDALIRGIYERPLTERTELLRLYNITINPETDEIHIIGGLASSGNLTELIEYLPLDKYRAVPWAYDSELHYALTNNRINILEYYKYQHRYGLIHNVHLNLLPSSLNRTDEEQLIRVLLESGYIELVKNFDVKDLLNQYPYHASQVAIYNHVDVLSYLYSINLPLIKPTLTDIFALLLLTISTFDLLFTHNDINPEIFKELATKKGKLLLNINPDLYYHIEDLGLI